eukprot:2364289-Pleurochrysis_carterae.AAC.1
MGSSAGGGLTRLRGGFDAVLRRSDVSHARTGARKPRAERDCSASTQGLHANAKMGNCACER